MEQPINERILDLEGYRTNKGILVLSQVLVGLNCTGNQMRGHYSW